MWYFVFQYVARKISQIVQIAREKISKLKNKKATGLESKRYKLHTGPT